MAEFPIGTKTFTPPNDDGTTEVNAGYMNQRDGEIEAIEAVLGAGLAPAPGVGVLALSNRLKLRADGILQVARLDDPIIDDSGVQLRVGISDCSDFTWLDIEKASKGGPMEIQARIVPFDGSETPADLALQPDGGSVGIGTTSH